VNELNVMQANWILVMFSQFTPQKLRHYQSLSYFIVPDGPLSDWRSELMPEQKSSS
jgi:hypothetical protein